MIRIEGASANQLWTMMGFVLPVATTLTLPVAALFAAAITYGRLSADNEFNACRSSGINVHVLFLPAVVISVGSAVFTFYCSHFVIPSFVRGVDQMVRKDLPKIVTLALQTQGHLKYGDVVVGAERIEPVSPERTKAGTKQFLIHGARVMQLEDDDLARYLSSEAALLTFDEQNGMPHIQCDMMNVDIYDRTQNLAWHQARQGFDRMIPLPTKVKEKWFDLPALLRYRARPQDLPDMRNQMDRLRGAVLEALVYRQVRDDLVTQGEFRFGGDENHYRLTAGGVSLDVRDKHPSFKDPVLEHRKGDIVERFTADRGYLRVEERYRSEAPEIQLVLDENVIRVDLNDPDARVELSEYEPEPVAVAPEQVARAAAVSDARLLDRQESLGLSKRVDDQQVSLSKEIEKRVHRIIGVIHSRSAFCFSVLLLVPLGAALGIVFRGGHVLTAFGISFVPGLVITVLIIMGRQLAENSGTSAIGVGIIWGSLAAMALVDVVVMTWFVRR
jgi:lipopolysaccharide export LptBFGC system permease protein LptF